MSKVGELLIKGTERLRAAGSETPRLDAELLLAHSVGVDRIAVVAHPEAPVGAGAAGRYEDALARRASGEPVAYVRGLKEFYGIAFAVDRRALIPRPETELMVELAEREVAERLAAAPRPLEGPPLRVVDIGTGAGTIAISLAILLRRRRMLGDVAVLATDLAPDALALARENAVAHGVADRVSFIEADLLPPVSEPFDVLLANLPYVPSAEVEGLPVAASFEPRLALDGGPDGLTAIRRLLAVLPERLAVAGVAFIEIGAGQEETIETAVGECLPGWGCVVHLDLEGRPRVARLARGA